MPVRGSVDVSLYWDARGNLALYIIDYHRFGGMIGCRVVASMQVDCAISGIVIDPVIFM